MYYFGYGSNMASSQMAAFCPTGQVIGVAKLADYRLAFTRQSQRWDCAAADVVASPGDVVWGVLYRIDDACLQGLNEKESLGIGYRHLNCHVVTVDGTAYAALTYEVIDKLTPEGQPSPAYLDTIIAGAMEANLPDDYVAHLRSIPTCPTS